jgi:hypothetical protein
MSLIKRRISGEFTDIYFRRLTGNSPTGEFTVTGIYFKNAREQYTCGDDSHVL